MKNDLHATRKHIDAIDAQLASLLNKRAALAQQLAPLKQSATYDPAREAQVVKQVIGSNAGPLSDAALSAIFREIITACLNLEQPLTIAYLGPEGTFSEAAARSHYGRMSTYMPCASTDEAIRTVEAGGADIAVVPVENSTEGPVNQTYNLLLQTRLHICGEVSLPIHHQLLTKAKTLQGVKEVVAHPQALGQCRVWLDEHLPGVKQTIAKSNAEAARLAAKSPGRAAIASTRAGIIYGLAALMENIEDDPSNTTRFVLLGLNETAPSGSDKTSLVCSTPDEPGALFKILGVLADRQVNMVKLESRPAPNLPWDYIFYIDIEGHQQEKQIAKTLAMLKSHTAFLKILGSYPRGD